MNYEYKITHLLNEKEINELSAEGWELQQTVIYCLQVVPEMPKMYFKRLVTTSPDINPKHSNPKYICTEN